MHINILGTEKYYRVEYVGHFHLLQASTDMVLVSGTFIVLYLLKGINK